MIKIVADTTSGLPFELAAQRGIQMIPQLVIFGEQTFRDDCELTSNEFLKKLKLSSALPKTAAPPPYLYFPIFEEAARLGDSVIILAPTASLSGTFRSAETARQDYSQADIRIIDTKTVAGCLGTLVLEAQQMVDSGLSVDEIETFIKNMIPHSRTYFVVDTLAYLQKGGRIGAAKALIGELFQVKPILQLNEGNIAPFVQERTKKRASARLIEIISEEAGKSQNPRISIMHIDAAGEAQAICDQLESCFGTQNIPIYLLPPAIVVHAGPKSLAVGFFN